MKGTLVQDILTSPYYSPPTTAIDKTPSKVSPLVEVIDLLARATATSSEVTARGLYDSAYKLLDGLHADMRSKEGALVRKHRPEIKRQMDALKRSRPTARELIKYAADFWSKAAAKP